MHVINGWPHTTIRTFTAHSPAWGEPKWFMPIHSVHGYSVSALIHANRIHITNFFPPICSPFDEHRYKVVDTSFRDGIESPPKCSFTIEWVREIQFRLSSQFGIFALNTFTCNEPFFVPQHRNTMQSEAQKMCPKMEFDARIDLQSATGTKAKMKKKKNGDEERNVPKINGQQIYI